MSRNWLPGSSPRRAWGGKKETGEAAKLERDALFRSRAAAAACTSSTAKPIFQ